MEVGEVPKGIRWSAKAGGPPKVRIGGVSGRGRGPTIKGAFYFGTPASAADPTYSDFWWTPGLSRPPYPLRDLPHFHGSPRTWDLGIKHQILTKWVPTELLGIKNQILMKWVPTELVAQLVPTS